MPRRKRRGQTDPPRPGQKIPLGDGQYMVLRSDLTMEDLKDISDMARRYDDENRVHFIDEAHGAAEAIGVLVEEWHLVPPCEPTTANYTALPISLGLRIQKVISDFLVHMRKEAHTAVEGPDFGNASAD